MLSWTEFSLRVIVLVGLVGASLAAWEHQAHGLVLLLCALGGVILGLITGKLSGSLAMQILCLRRRPSGFQFIAYVLIPLIAAFLVWKLAFWIIAHFPGVF